MSELTEILDTDAIRARAEHHGVKFWTEDIFALLDALAATDAEVERLRAVVAMLRRGGEQLGRLLDLTVDQRDHHREQMNRGVIARNLARDFVDYPGNWSATDGRRRLLLRLLDGETVEWER